MHGSGRSKLASSDEMKDDRQQCMAVAAQDLTKRLPPPTLRLGDANAADAADAAKRPWNQLPPRTPSPTSPRAPPSPPPLAQPLPPTAVTDAATDAVPDAVPDADTPAATTDAPYRIDPTRPHIMHERRQYLKRVMGWSSPKRRAAPPTKHHRLADAVDVATSSASSSTAIVVAPLLERVRVSNDEPPVMKLVRESREAKAQHDADMAAKAERERHTRFQPTSVVQMFPLCKRPITDPAHANPRGVDFEADIEVCRKLRQSSFVAVEELPHLYLDHNEAFAHSQCVVRRIVADLPRRDADFKCGVTRGPGQRFLTRENYGYFNLGYRRMHVVFAGSSTWCAELEKRLIATYYNGIDDRCRNVAPGGENVPSDGVGRFVYIVTAPKGLGNERRDQKVLGLRHACFQFLG